MIFDPKVQQTYQDKMRGKIFSIASMEEKLVAYPSQEMKTNIWNKRLGHFYHKSLLYMFKKDIVRGLQLMEYGHTACTICQLGKQSRMPFAKETYRALVKLQLVHTGFFLLTTHECSLNESKYFIAFIDDMTQLCWIYFLKLKPGVPEVSSKFKALVENQSGCRIKILRTGNGTINFKIFVKM